MMGFWFMFLAITFSAIQLVPQDVGAVSCTITKYNADDIRNAQNDCTEIIINGIEVAAGETLDLSHLQQGAKVVFQGTITWTYQEWEGPLLSVAGTNVQISGADGHVLDGRGSLWWDGRGWNGGKRKPKFFSATKLINSDIYNINIKDTPVHTFSISNCDGLVIEEAIINISAGDTGSGLNTDAFDIDNSSNITIRHSTVYNQGDCLAIYSGTEITFYDNHCSGGHGITIGAVGGRNNNIVKSVKIYESEIVDSDNGIRIQTTYGATGYVSNIFYQDITLASIHKYGIVIEGDYQLGSHIGTPSGGVPVTDLTVKNIHGTVDSSGANIYILVENATNWNFSDINITGGSKSVQCTGIPSSAGVSC